MLDREMKKKRERKSVRAFYSETCSIHSKPLMFQEKRRGAPLRLPFARPVPASGF